VNLNTGKVYICESKAYKDRIIMMSEDMLRLCKKYENFICMVLPDREYFFPNKNGVMIGKQSLTTYFNKCCEAAGISNGSSKPRAYFLRNTHINKIRTFPKECRKHTYPSEKGSDNKLTILVA